MLGVDERTIEDARLHQGKLHGRRFGKKQPAEPTTSTDDSAIPKNISVSQRSYLMRSQHFTGLISLLKCVNGYMTNETELTISSLEAKLVKLEEIDSKVMLSVNVLCNSRAKRDKLLYDMENGVITTALCIKAYIRSVFGTRSDNYQLIKIIKFKRRKKL
jgi:hypothetical protein